MTKDLFDQILALVLPEMSETNPRKALVEAALFGSPVLEQLEWSGAAWPFTVNLLARLYRFGESKPGQSALAALLIELRGQIGINRQAELDTLLPQLNALPAQADEAFVVQWQQAWEPAQQAKAQPPDWQRFRLGRIAEWSQPRYDLEKRFVNLTLLLDRGESEPQRWHKAEDFRFNDLRDVLAETSEHPALVLLGAPGSGKSTLLRRLQLDHSLERLRDEDDKVSFFVPLNSYRASKHGESVEPGEWLQRRWAEAYPQLEPLPELLQAGRVVLLLDALNEMPHASTNDYFRLVGLWRTFAQEAALHGNRVIFTCRSLDYSASLSSKDLRVPQIEVQPLNAEQVRAFLRLYTLNHEARVWSELNGKPQFGLFQTPYFLKLLCEQVEATGGHVPQGRASLFTGFVRQALQREIEGALFQPDAQLLDERDHGKLTRNDWRNAFELPERGLLVPKLSALAFGMQRKGLETESAQVRIDYDEACAMLDHPCDKTLLKAGCALNVLDESHDEILFFHQLLQEYFAARQLAKQPDPALVHVEWANDKVIPKLAETLAKLADGDPLPPLAQTGWEETTLTAAPMAREPEAFIRQLIPHNLPLAARCAAAAESTVHTALKDELRRLLLARLQDFKTADVRARIAAAEALGLLGDLRFAVKEGPHGEYLLPPLVEIAGGTYPIGDDKGNYEDEKPAHKVELAPFAIGQFPVTNAEYAKFIAADGYEDERWWDTAEALAWLRGESTAEGEKVSWRDHRKLLQGFSEDELRGMIRQNRATTVQVEEWLETRNQSADEFEQWLNDEFPPGTFYREPGYWNDGRFNNPLLPVVGVSWYEARAYCHWLTANATDGQVFRLPTEFEFEAAARGQAGRQFPYGKQFDSARCNTFESHLRRTTPVGIFDNATPELAFDLSGNAYTWTLSIYDQQKFPYPYRKTDGREDITANDVKRVLRGGAWGSDQRVARAVYRDFDPPGDRYSNFGFRVVVSRPPSF